MLRICANFCWESHMTWVWVLIKKRKVYALWRNFTYHSPGGVATSDGIKSDDLVCDMKQASFRRRLKNLFDTDVSAHAVNTKFGLYVSSRERDDAGKSA